MALEHLLATLERDAEAKARRLLAEARAEAERVAAEAAERRARRRAELDAGQEAAVATAARHALAEEKLRARRAVLEARQRLLGRVLAAASARLPGAAADPAYAARLPEEVEEALSYLGDLPAVLACPPGLAPLLEGLAAGRPGVTVVTDPALAAGFRALAADGSVAVDATLPGLLQRRWPELAAGVLRRLGGEEGGAP